MLVIQRSPSQSIVRRSSLSFSSYCELRSDPARPYRGGCRPRRHIDRPRDFWCLDATFEREAVPPCRCLLDAQKLEIKNTPREIPSTSPRVPANYDKALTCIPRSVSTAEPFKIHPIHSTVDAPTGVPWMNGQAPQPPTEPCCLSDNSGKSFTRRSVDATSKKPGRRGRRSENPCLPSADVKPVDPVRSTGSPDTATRAPASAPTNEPTCASSFILWICASASPSGSLR
jgi:hypothetical protein